MELLKRTLQETIRLLLLGDAAALPHGSRMQIPEKRFTLALTLHASLQGAGSKDTAFVIDCCTIGACVHSGKEAKANFTNSEGECSTFESV